ncbi:MAG: hypothetical protein WBC71_04405 [Salaquimonas sp.]
MVKSVFIIGTIWMLSGCVSSTLETSQFKPVGAQQNSISTQDTSSNQPVALAQDAANETGDINSNDPNAISAAARAQGIQEMRSKAEGRSGEKTHIGALPEPAAQQLSAEEQAQKANELKAAAAEASASVSDAEIDSKQNSIRRLQKKARSHYDDAVQGIEN